MANDVAAAQEDEQTSEGSICAIFLLPEEIPVAAFACRAELSWSEARRGEARRKWQRGWVSIDVWLERLKVEG